MKPTMKNKLSTGENAMILHHYIWGDIDIDIVEEVAPHFLIAKHYGNLALFCRLTKHQSHYFRNSDKRFYAVGFDDEGINLYIPSCAFLPKCSQNICMKCLLPLRNWHFFFAIKK